MYTSNNPLIQNTVLGSKFLDPNYLFSLLSAVVRSIFTAQNLTIFYFILSMLSIFFIFVLIYTTIRMFEIRKKEHAHLHHEIEEYAHNQILKLEESNEKGVFKNERWKKVLDYLFSANGNDWKLAIIEADSMLSDLITQLGFKGDTLGDKLKDAGQSNFRYLDSAWEVHNIRNKIAHEGSSFEVSLHEAKRVISLYEEIFIGFGYI